MTTINTDTTFSPTWFPEKIPEKDAETASNTCIFTHPIINKTWIISLSHALFDPEQLFKFCELLTDGYTCERLISGEDSCLTGFRFWDVDKVMSYLDNDVLKKFDLGKQKAYLLNLERIIYDSIDNKKGDLLEKIQQKISSLQDVAAQGTLVYITPQFTEQNFDKKSYLNFLFNLHESALEPYFLYLDQEIYLRRRGVDLKLSGKISLYDAIWDSGDPEWRALILQRLPFCGKLVELLPLFMSEQGLSDAQFLERIELCKVVVQKNRALEIHLINALNQNQFPECFKEINPFTKIDLLLYLNRLIKRSNLPESQVLREKIGALLNQLSETEKESVIHQLPSQEAVALSLRHFPNFHCKSYIQDLQLCLLKVEERLQQEILDAQEVFLYLIGKPLFFQEGVLSALLHSKDEDWHSLGCKKLVKEQTQTINQKLDALEDPVEIFSTLFDMQELELIKVLEILREFLHKSQTLHASIFAAMKKKLVLSSETDAKVCRSVLSLVALVDSSLRKEWIAIFKTIWGNDCLFQYVYSMTEDMTVVNEREKFEPYLTQLTSSVDEMLQRVEQNYRYSFLANLRKVIYCSCNSEREAWLQAIEKHLRLEPQVQTGNRPFKLLHLHSQEEKNRFVIGLKALENSDYCDFRFKEEEFWLVHLLRMQISLSEKKDVFEAFWRCTSINEDKSWRLAAIQILSHEKVATIYEQIKDDQEQLSALIAAVPNETLCWLLSNYEIPHRYKKNIEARMVQILEADVSLAIDTIEHLKEKNTSLISNQILKKLFLTAKEKGMLERALPLFIKKATFFQDENLLACFSFDPGVKLVLDSLQKGKLKQEKYLENLEKTIQTVSYTDQFLVEQEQLLLGVKAPVSFIACSLLKYASDPSRVLRLVEQAFSSQDLTLVLQNFKKIVKVKPELSNVVLDALEKLIPFEKKRIAMPFLTACVDLLQEFPSSSKKKKVIQEVKEGLKSFKTSQSSSLMKVLSKEEQKCRPSKKNKVKDTSQVPSSKKPLSIPKVITEIKKGIRSGQIKEMIPLFEENHSNILKHDSSEFISLFVELLPELYQSEKVLKDCLLAISFKPKDYSAEILSRLSMIFTERFPVSVQVMLVELYNNIIIEKKPPFDQADLRPYFRKIFEAFRKINLDGFMGKSHLLLVLCDFLSQVLKKKDPIKADLIDLSFQEMLQTIEKAENKEDLYTPTTFLKERLKNRDFKIDQIILLFTKIAQKFDQFQEESMAQDLCKKMIPLFSEQKESVLFCLYSYRLLKDYAPILKMGFNILKDNLEAIETPSAIEDSMRMLLQQMLIAYFKLSKKEKKLDEKSFYVKATTLIFNKLYYASPPSKNYHDFKSITNPKKLASCLTQEPRKTWAEISPRICDLGHNLKYLSYQTGDMKLQELVEKIVMRFLHFHQPKNNIDLNMQIVKELELNLSDPFRECFFSFPKITYSEMKKIKPILASMEPEKAEKAAEGLLDSLIKNIDHIPFESCLALLKIIRKLSFFDSNKFYEKFIEVNSSAHPYMGAALCYQFLRLNPPTTSKELMRALNLISISGDWLLFQSKKCFLKDIQKGLFQDSFYLKLLGNFVLTHPQEVNNEMVEKLQNYELDPFVTCDIFKELSIQLGLTGNFTHISTLSSTFKLLKEKFWDQLGDQYKKELCFFPSLAFLDFGRGCDLPANILNQVYKMLDFIPETMRDATVTASFWDLFLLYINSREKFEFSKSKEMQSLFVEIFIKNADLSAIPSQISLLDFKKDSQKDCSPNWNPLLLEVPEEAMNLQLFQENFDLCKDEFKRMKPLYLAIKNRFPSLEQEVNTLYLIHFNYEYLKNKTVFTKNTEDEAYRVLVSFLDKKMEVSTAKLCYVTLDYFETKISTLKMSNDYERIQEISGKIERIRKALVGYQNQSSVLKMPSSWKEPEVCLQFLFGKIEGDFLVNIEND